MDEEILGSVLHGIKPKDYTPIQVRPTPEFGGIQLTEEQQAKKDNMESVKDGEILPLGGFTDTVEAQWESAKDLVKSTDVYKNLFGNSAPDDNRLEQSEKLGSALGIAPQLIASDPDMYKAAVTTYERQRNAAALNNQPFSAKILNELYPELDTEDPVATTIALKDYTNILKNREAAAQGAAVYTMPESKLTDLSNVIGYLYDTGTHFAGTAYEAGQALDAQSELMYKASIGEISDEEVEKAIPGLMNAQKAYNAEIGDSYVAKIVGETISQLSMQKNMIMRGAAEILAPIAPLAQPILAATKTNLPQIASLGAASAAGAVGATGAVAGAAVTGAAALAGLIALGTASVFTGTYRAEAGQAYWDWRTKKDKNGKSVYTREQAIGHAKRVGVINAAIETGAWELALKGITRVWGSDAAKAVIKNEAAMKKLIGAGRAAVGAKAIGYGAKQFAKVAAPEIAEEGLQSLSADIDTSLFGKEPIPMREMMRNALDAMIEAVPSVVGMSIGGAALAGAGAHRAMKRIAGLSEMKDAVIEFKRENERSMLQKLMDLRSESSLYKKAPETYRKTLQNQLDHTGSGTLYIDASAAAENEKTHDALNKLVEDGTITAKELDDAIKTGKPLEVETGKYMQTATPETHEALSDYTTMDKGEKTIHAIREERQRMKDMIDIVTMTREKREAAATEKILNDHFSDDTDIGREDRDTAREILSGGLDHIEDTCKTILQEAKDAWGKLTGVKELQDYMERRKTQDANFSNEKGVDIFDVGEGEDRVHLRVSKNPDWYQDFYGAYGRAPNQRELYDIAQEKIIAENDKGDEESKAAIAEIEEAKKRVESIERVSETLKSLNKEDLIAQTLLDPETYEEAYKPLLEEIKVAGNGAVTKAARDSALVLAKLAENFHRNYGVPLKLAIVKMGEVAGIREGAYGMAAFEIRKAGATKVSQLLERIDKGISHSAIRFTDDNGVSWAGERIPHIRKHLTDEEIQDLSEHIGTIEDYAPSDWQDGDYKGQHEGKHYVVKVKGGKGTYYAVLSFAENGKIWIATAVNDKQSNQYKKEIGAFHAEMLTDKAAASDSHQNAPIPLQSLQEKIGIVKKSTYHQMAGEYAHDVLSGKLTKKGMAERQLDADEKSFVDSVDRFMAGKISTDTIQVMRTPLVMRLVGAEVLPVEISVSDLKKVLVDKHTDITPDIMKQIPRALTDPMMIFSTYSGKNGEARKVIVLELKDENGATIVVPMELEHMSDGYKVNRMTSTYGKTDRKTGEPSYEWFKKQLEAGNLEYVNRKKATDWISTEQPDWLIPKEKVDNLLSAPNVANEEDLVKLKSENPTYYQTAADKDLVVYHNVSAGKLREAIKLGGLPMPSLAITKRDIPFGDFGEITLIGDKDMIDPRKSRSNEVFSRDAYTVRKPVVNYEEPTAQDQKVFHEKYSGTIDELKAKGIDVQKINFTSYSGDEALARMENDVAIRYFYIQNVLKKNVPIHRITIAPTIYYQEIFRDYPGILKALRKRARVKNSAFLELDKACQPYFKRLEEKIKNKEGLVGLNKRRLERLQKDGHVTIDGAQLLSKWANEYEKSARQKPREEVDKQTFEKNIQKTIEEAGMDKFIVFVRSEFDNLYKGKYLWDNGKKYAFNIDNIVKLMKKYSGTNNEGTGGINYGFNSLLAFLSKKFTSIRDIKNHESLLAPNKKELARYKKAEDMYNRLIDEAAELRGSYGMDLDMDLAELMKDTRDGKKDLHGFPEDKKFLQHIKDFLKEANKITTDYFEAKPARKVTFDEFSGAVIPKGTPEETVNFLESQGIVVREYDQDVEGDREAKAKELSQKLNVYFQNKYQGSYDRNANVIELFDGANESTVIHEGAHMFLSMLENMSQMSEENAATYFNGDTAKARAALKSMQGDLSTIRSWAAFSEEHLAEYKGTILEKEFTQYANDIQAGKAGAMERWMQERFARGFEKYLMDGSAPTKEMQGVFRRFKKWLTDIYKTAKNLGNVELTPEIKDIFDRMISTESEINAWAAQRKLEAIDKTVNVNQSELGNLKAWAESVKDKALEKAMSYYLHMVREEAIENFKASISSEEERTSYSESLGEENEIYQIETIYNSDTFPTKKDRDEFLQMAGLTEKDLKEKLRAAGGTMEERWNKHIEEMVQHYREEALTPEAIRGMAEEILRSPEGMAKKSRIEAMLLEKKVSAYIHLVNSMQMELKRSKDKKKTAREIRKRLGLVSEKETTEIDKQTDVIAKSEDKIAKLEKQKKLLKEQLEKAKAEAAAAKGENKSRKESQTILEGNMRALEAELEKERAQRAKADSTTKDAELTAADLAVQLQTMVDGLKESRDAMRFDMREIKEDARNTLGGEKLSHATSWRWWENKAQIAEARAMKAAAGNDWEGAAYWKREQAQCLTMAKFARANEEEIRRTLHGGGGKVTTPLLNENGMERYGILGILNRISRTDKPVLMKDDARYFVQHMAYVLGLTKKDGILPIDESGQERPFNWRWLAVEMNPMQAMDDDRYMAEDIIPGWMRSAFDGSSPLKLKDLTMNQFREMAKVMKAVYKLGRREYEGNTLGTSFDEASQKIHDEILGNWTHRVATPGLKNQTATSLDRLGTKIHSLIKDITLPEILIERLGKSAAEYFYKPMDKAAAHLRELKSAARVTFRKNFAIYSRKEWTAIRSKKLYTVGLDERGKPVSYTKEQLLAMALNFGTKSNRARLIETLWLSDTLNTDEKTILDMLDKNLTDKDWDFVESVWEHLNSYWGERNKVQNDLYGTPLGKVQGEDFTLKSGRIIHGQYYRIKYDPLSSTKTSNFTTTDIAKMDMQNISSFSLGMGSTKQRAGASGGQKLRLDLDVYVEAVNEAMQHIAMREATVDVYKLLNRKEVVAAIENTAGPETLSLLQGWAKDCWHSSIKDMSEWDSTLGRARRRFNFTTMGFRFSTALLNIGNITGMMERMGAANALKAVGDFYFHGNIVEQRRFIQTKSTMMRDRGATIDRDMYMQDRLPVGKNESEFRSKIEHGKYGVDTLNSKAYWLIQATDEMFSLPEWLFTYKRAMAAMEIEGKLNRDEMDAEAVRLADKAVRETFGSNETKDQTSFTRKNGILAQMTTFYSYTSLVTNQFIRAGYILYDKGDVKPLLAAMWYWWILGALVETTLREIGDDSDDEDKWKKKFLHVIASGGPIGGVPLAREAVPWTVDFFTGKSFGSAAPDAPFFDTLKHMEKFLKATKKGDLIEMGRGATKAITRTSIPVPDTITDAFWNFMRLTCTDTEFTMWDWFRKSLWDKTLKEKKK
nr:MAG TPA: crystallin beta/gamma motif-containing protein [Caudoviricetes sp.]